MFLAYSCATPEQSPDNKRYDAAPGMMDDLNRQIDDFNANRMPRLGIHPIEQRVSRIEYDKEKDVVRCYDGDNNNFLTLERQSDGRFKGTIETKFHSLEDETGMREWGKIKHDFFLPKDSLGKNPSNSTTQSKPNALDGVCFGLPDDFSGRLNEIQELFVPEGLRDAFCIESVREISSAKLAEEIKGKEIVAEEVVNGKRHVALLDYRCADFGNGVSGSMRVIERYRIVESKQ
jgi:hypothetical protein